MSTIEVFYGIVQVSSRDGKEKKIALLQSPSDNVHVAGAAMAVEKDRLWPNDRYIAELLKITSSNVDFGQVEKVFEMDLIGPNAHRVSLL